MGSGCYGINGADTVSYDAALLSQAAGKPVRIQLTRKDEMAWENYGLAFVIDERAGVDKDGTIVVWDHEVLVSDNGRQARRQCTRKRCDRPRCRVSARSLRGAVPGARSCEFRE
jgi:CO/xanthine dehydrogenase Mo-binding subunit